MIAVGEKSILLIILILFFTSSLRASCFPDFRVEVGEEEYVMGPVREYIDFPFFTIFVSGGIRAYSSNGNTYTFFGTNLDSLALQGIALSKGGTGKFDECGAWLASVYKLDEGHWIGWYHAEEKCDYTQGVTHKSMAFAESYDSGRTWTKTDYPNNQVLTADVSFSNDPTKDDAGDAWVIRIGDYFYMFFLASADWRIHLARSKVSDLGKPGTWYKYYNGQFDQPGIGGKSTPIQNLYSSFVSYNSYLNRYISIQTYGRWGFLLSVSEGDNILSWQVYPKIIYPLVSHNDDQTVDDWVARDDKSKQVYGYPSLIGIDGSSNITGQQFYLYYMKVFPKEDFDRRYLLRRKITLHKNPTYSFLAKVSLTRYEKQNPKKTKVSTEISKPDEGYQKISKVGYLLSYPENNFRSLYECYIPIWQDYMPSIADPSVFNWEHCENVGDVFIRRIGWISKIQTLDATVPLYRCFDEQNRDHFLSTDPNCEGKTKEYLIGYIFQRSFDELTFKYLLLNYFQNNFQADTNYDGKVNSFDFGKMIICSQ